MGLPRKLKQMALFVKGEHYAGQCPEVTLPTLERETEDYRGGAMNGPVKADLGAKEMTISIKMAGWVAAIVKEFGGDISGLDFRLVQAVQADDSADVQGVEVIGRGRMLKADFGTAKPGDMTEHEYEIALTYLKIVDNGETLLEIDFLNMIERVGDVDRMEQTRAILGI